MSPYGGGKRVRTADPLLAGQVLYQLSYTPVFSASCGILREQNKCSAKFRSMFCIKNEWKEMKVSVSTENGLAISVLC